MNKAHLPTDAKARKDAPIARGVLDYFPLAVAAVAELSRIGNEQHNPGQPMHWAREKSTDHADCIVRHLIDRGKLDTDGVRHATKVAWRALALLQTEIEDAQRGDESAVETPAPKPPRPPAYNKRLVGCDHAAHGRRSVLGRITCTGCGAEIGYSGAMDVVAVDAVS